MGVQKADDCVDVVNSGWEGVWRCVAVYGGDDDGAGGACQEVAETGIELWEATYKPAAVHVEMQRAGFSVAGVAVLFVSLKYKDADRSAGVDCNVFGGEGAGEEPWGAADGVGYECGGLEDQEHAPTLGKGDVVSKERIDAWTEPAS